MHFTVLRCSLHNSVTMWFLNLDEATVAPVGARPAPVRIALPTWSTRKSWRIPTPDVVTTISK